MKRFIIDVLLGVGLITAFLQPVVATEYSALTKETSPQQGVRTGRIFVGKDGIRTEVVVNGEKRVQIINFRNNEMFLVNPASHTYMRKTMPKYGSSARKTDLYAVRPANPCEGRPEYVCKSQGMEQVHGRSAVKWSVTPSGNARGDGMTVWLDQQRNVPVKQVLPNGATMSRRMLGNEQVNQRPVEKWETTLKGPDGTSNMSTQWYAIPSLARIFVKSRPACTFAICSTSGKNSSRRRYSPCRGTLVR